MTTLPPCSHLRTLPLRNLSFEDVGNRCDLIHFTSCSRQVIDTILLLSRSTAVSMLSRILNESLGQSAPVSPMGPAPSRKASANLVTPSLGEFGGGAGAGSGEGGRELESEYGILPDFIGVYVFRVYSV